MQKQNKTNNKQNKVSQKANKEAKVMQKVEQPKVRLEDTIYSLVKKAMETDKNIRIQPVTGYVGIKYGNKVLFEFHDKKKAISHLTFSKQQKAYEILNANKLIQRVVPKSYGWKYDTECLLSAEFLKHFPAILKSVIAEAIEERNLKNAPKKADKKVAKA